MTQTDVVTFKRYGIDRALFSLNGYEGSLPNLLDTLDKKGYLASKYDIYTDVWPSDQFPAETSYRRQGYPEDVIVNKDGSLQKGGLANVNFQPFRGNYTWRKTNSAFATIKLLPELSENHNNTRLIMWERAST